jgi:hypothetical protein
MIDGASPWIWIRSATMKLGGYVGTAALAAACMWSTIANAAEGDAATAEALFEQARQEMDQKNYDSACEKFRESQRLDPAPGTLLNLANCEEQRGKLATAWELYRAAMADLPADDSRMEVAKTRVSDLSARIPKLTIKLAAGSPQGTVVVRDGVELGAASLGTALPVDPGEHEIVVRAPGHADSSTRVSLAERETKVVDVAPGPAGEGGSAVGAGDTGGDSGSSQRTLGYVLGGVGVAGVGVAVVTGFMALGKKSTVDEHCDSDRFCDAEGADAAESGRTLATVSTVGWIVGALGIGAGVYFILSSGSDGKSETGVRAAVGPGATSVNLLHRW